MTPTEQMVDVPPDPNQILADMAREGMGWEKALGEPIDNSLDAGADRIVIKIDKKARLVSVTDNGDGCDQPHKMFVSGFTTKRGRRTLGRYGVGLKHSSYYFCQADGVTSVITGHDGVFRRASVCWGEIVQSGRWQIRAPFEVSAAEAAIQLGDLRGTKIEFTPIKCGWLSDPQMRSVEDKLAFTFSPALRAGKQIKFVVGGKARTLAAPEDPVWSESMEFDVEVSGKRARVKAGILALNDKSGRRGLSYLYGHRVIVPDTNDGCGEHSTQGFAGFVELDERWGLGQNKSQVVDDEWPQLTAAIHERLAPLLDKLRNSTLQMHSEALRGVLAGALNAMLGTARRPNRRGSKRGDASKPTERKVERAAIVSGLGAVLGRSKRGAAITVDWDDDPQRVEAARVDPSGSRVYLNRCNAGVKDAHDRGDERVLAIIVASHLFHFCARNELFGVNAFDESMGRLLASPLVMQVAEAAGAA